MDNVEMAQDSFEHVHEHGEHEAGHGGQAHPTPTSTRLAAVLVAVLAAAAVVVEMSGNDKQTEYLAHDVAASDLWTQYQGKSVRRTVLLGNAELLEAQAGALPPPPAGSGTASADRIAAVRAQAARMEDDPGHDGMQQLSARAKHEEEERDHALRLHSGFERSVRGLQIAIVLVGLFMATRLFWLLGVGGALGGLALVYGVLTALWPA